MAKKTTTTESDSRAVLESLSQTDVAWLIGKPSSWVRDQNHKFERNNGRYDARQVVAVMGSEFTAATLGDDLLEPVCHLCDDVADFAVCRFRPAVELLEGIERRHGAPGLAAVAVRLLEVLRERAESEPETRHPTEQEIRERAEAEIDRLATIDARQTYKRLVTCGKCHRYRWGSKFRSGPIPNGYAIVDEITCPECESKQSRRRSRSMASLSETEE